jgi:hypothetical protein
MNVFYLKKWFFDVLLPQKAYLYFYITQINLFGIKLSRINIHYVPEKNAISLSEPIKLEVKSIVSFGGPSGFFSQQQNVIQIKQKTGQLFLELNYKNELHDHPGHLPIELISKKKGSIQWMPIIIKSQVEGLINLGKLYVPIKQHYGYIGYVNATISPYKNPISELYWGRLHSSDLDLSYSISYVKKENTYYSYCFCRIDNQFFYSDKAQLTIIKKDWSNKLDLNYPKVISIAIQVDNYKLLLYIDQKKILMESVFIDEQQKMNWCLLQFLKKFSKNPRGLKFLSMGEVEIRRDNSLKVLGGNLISEYIRFGKE